MTLKLSKNDTAAYDYLSEDGSMTNPVVCSAQIDKTGGEVTSPSVQLYLVATDEGEGDIGKYTDIQVTPSTAQDGITWEVSLDDTSFSASIEPGDMDVTESDQTTPVWVRFVADNTESSPLNTGNHAAECEITAVENPPEL